MDRIGRIAATTGVRLAWKLVDKSGTVPVVIFTVESLPAELDEFGERFKHYCGGFDSEFGIYTVVTASDRAEHERGRKPADLEF